MSAEVSEKGNAVLGLLILVGLFFVYRWWTTPTWYVMDMSPNAIAINTCMSPNAVQPWKRSPEALAKFERDKGDDVADSGLIGPAEIITDRTSGQSWTFLKRNDAGKELCREAAEQNGG